MYPAHGVALFPPFPRDHRVFVAMSFNLQFEARWSTVIAPGIAGVRLDNRSLEPFRIDIPRTAASLPAAIVEALAQSRLVFCDVTSLDGHRNGNVMYEIGIAHAIRQPEEVVMFRSDKESLLFDIAGIRVNAYDPDVEPDAARERVAVAISAALQEVQMTQAATVKRMTETLDLMSAAVLFDVVARRQFPHPQASTFGELTARAPIVSAITRLLELGLITAAWGRLDLEATNMEIKPLADWLRSSAHYAPTELGKVVVARLGESLELGRYMSVLVQDERDGNGEN